MTNQTPHARPPRANPHPWAESFAVAGIAWGVALIALFAFVGPPASPRGAGYAAGRALAPFLIGAVITALIARSSRKVWRWWRYVLFVFMFAVVVSFLGNAGRAGGPAGADAASGSPAGIDGRAS